MLSPNALGHVALVGIGATAVMDLWLVLLARLGVPTTSFALVGRWVGYFPSLRFLHAPIFKSPPVRFESGLGWATHYLVRMAYAALLVAVEGVVWIGQPTFLPALTLGCLTVAVPWFVMQPAMGAGILASKTPTPLRNCLRSLLIMPSSAVACIWQLRP